MSSSPLPQVKATLSLSCSSSLVGYSGSFSRLKLKAERGICVTIIQTTNRGYVIITSWSPCSPGAGSGELVRGIFCAGDCEFRDPGGPHEVHKPPKWDSGTEQLQQKMISTYAIECVYNVITKLYTVNQEIHACI